MKAIYMEAQGAPEVLKFGEQPDPVAGPGQVVCDIHAASVKAADWKVRAGGYEGGPIESFPYILGRDFSGVVTAAGGKYTTSRVFASHVVDRAARKAGMRIPRSRTPLVPLDACAVGSTERFVAAVRDAPAPVAPETGEWLARHYGTDAAAVLASAEGRPELLEPLDADGEIAAQAVFAARHESALHLTDVMLRTVPEWILGDD